MVQKLLTLVLVGLGIVHGTNGGAVAGLADLRPTTSANLTPLSPTAVSPELKAARARGLTASTSAYTAFRQKLSSIRDAAKKTQTERINTTLNEVNTKRTNMLLSYVNRLTDILTKVQTRAAAVKTAGRDTSKVDAAIAKAQTDIATAKSAILAQAAKQYTATISSENTLKSDMGRAMSQLQADAGSVKDLVTAAHKSVSDAIQTLASVLGEKIASSSATTK